MPLAQAACSPRPMTSAPAGKAIGHAPARHGLVELGGLFLLEDRNPPTMANIIESSGDIEVMSQAQASVGDRVKLVFAPINALNPPYHLKIISPSGKAIVDNI